MKQGMGKGVGSWESGIGNRESGFSTKSLSNSRGLPRKSASFSRKTLFPTPRKRSFRNSLLPILLLLLLLTPSLSAQQITKFAVVDMGRVYTSFFRESRAVRSFEEKSVRVQAEIDKQTNEIQDLKAERLEAEAAGDSSRAQRLASEEQRKSAFLKEYYTTKTAELERERASLGQSREFIEQVTAEVKLIAETEGYSMVLNLNNNSSIVWYSPSVDITDRVIQRLKAKGR